MSIAICYSAHLVGLKSEIVTVEVDISNGLHALSIVGLGDRAVDEAKDRISAAIKNSGYISPKQKNQKVVISLAPADIRKEGPAFDLPMALGYLSAAGELVFSADKTLFLGELSLEGRVRRVAGVLPILCQAGKHGFTKAFIPAGNAEEASLASGIEVYAVSSLAEIAGMLTGKVRAEPVQEWVRPAYTGASDTLWGPPATARNDMRVIRGNEAAKRGLEIAAAGGHNVLMYGPPGTGKTMLAQSFPTILPPMTREEAVEVTSIHSAAHGLTGGLLAEAPFRAPHHTASYPAIVGGGAFPRPGEITLAHRGVLFMDELPEFDRSVLEALRQPLEEHAITVARARGTVTFPAQCILIASMNPCPCGNPKGKGCICTPGRRRAYHRRISGPILDRIDLWIGVSKVDYGKLATRDAEGEPSSTVRDRVIRARAMQKSRFELAGIRDKKCNGELDANDIEKCVRMEDVARSVLAHASEKLSLSGRAFHRIIKIARTIADLGDKEILGESDILEALQYRQTLGS